jgi:hypothetical protein
MRRRDDRSVDLNPQLWTCRKFLPPTPQRLRLQARLIREAKAAGDVAYLRFIRVAQAKDWHERRKAIRPPERSSRLMRPSYRPPPPRRLLRFARHVSSLSGEEVAPSC